jgi:hypothetical protein
VVEYLPSKGRGGRRGEKGGRNKRKLYPRKVPEKNQWKLLEGRPSPRPQMPRSRVT